jgi:tetratricopeptide (TPR) repeat protein
LGTAVAALPSNRFGHEDLIMFSSASSCAPFAALVVLVLHPLEAFSQEYTIASLTKVSTTPPIWSQPAAGESQSLKDVMRQLQRSVFLVGSPDFGTGTAFVISREHRLLATNAHVADILFDGDGKMFAIANGDTTTCEIVETYYHPGVRRIAGEITVQSTDPAKGHVYPKSPDVAVLRLGPGSELPPPLLMATPDELYDLMYDSVAMLGFPGHDTEGWPEAGHRPGATYRVGHISRLSDFLNDASLPPEQRQCLQHSMASWGGFSGSPIFLPNGHVVGLHNSAKTLSNESRIESLQYGVRVDCLWELLKRHDLLDEVTIPIEPTSINVERYAGPDVGAELLTRVRRLLAQARIDLSRHDEAAAIEKCNEAATLIPNFPPVYDVRYNAYNFVAVYRIKARTKEALGLYKLAYDDAVRAFELEPSVDHFLDKHVAEMNLVNAAQPTGYLPQPEFVAEIDKLLGMEGIRPRDRAYAYRARAFAQGLGRDALADLERAMRADPWIPQNYSTLVIFWNRHGDAAAARRAQEKFDAISAAEADADQAWLSATSPNEGQRNGDFAHQLAEKACTATDYAWWKPLRTLAAAYAELGQFDRAVEYATKAVALAPPDEAGDVRRQLARYNRQEPWRED